MGVNTPQIRFNRLTVCRIMFIIESTITLWQDTNTRHVQTF